LLLSHGPPRGEDKNWYTLPIEERARQMGEHGMVGRRYAGEVQADHHRLDRLRRLGMGVSTFSPMILWSSRN